MEIAQEETSGGTNDQAHIVVKGKRTKRQRLQLPPLAASDDRDREYDRSSQSGENGNWTKSDDLLQSSPTTSAEISGSATEEEEDMANCLILLAQGGGRESPRLEEDNGSGGERFVKRKLSETPNTTNGKAGLYVYQCKTCNRCFPSFQALGGHRASHRKPKIEENPNQNQNQNPNHCLELQIGGKPIWFNSSIGAGSNNNQSSSKPRVHECSICGTEFASGQALGGHMRRHRAAIVESSSQETNKKQKGMLSLDLNLPAPQDEDRDFPKSPSTFSFAGKQPLVFSASALVDCHY